MLSTLSLLFTHYLHRNTMTGSLLFMDATIDELFTDFTIEELLDQFDDTLSDFRSVERELEELRNEIEWLDEFDLEDCDDEDELERFESIEGNIDSMRDEVYDMEGQLEEIEDYYTKLEYVIERICGKPKYYILTSRNQYVSGPHYMEPRTTEPLQNVVKVYPNSILMSEEILNEERNARQW